MVNFYPGYVSAARNRWDADYAAEQARYDSPPFAGLYIGQPDRAKAALDEWVKAHPAPKVTLAEVADHIEHVRRVAGIDHVGLGSDFDGIPVTPTGLEGVDKYPDLLAELMRRGWTDDDSRQARRREHPARARRRRGGGCAPAHEPQGLGGDHRRAGRRGEAEELKSLKPGALRAPGAGVAVVALLDVTRLGDARVGQCIGGRPERIAAVPGGQAEDAGIDRGGGAACRSRSGPAHGAAAPQGS